MGVTYLAVASDHPLAQLAAQEMPELLVFCQACQKTDVSEATLETMEKRGMATGFSQSTH